jgi:hypothetical protein
MYSITKVFLFDIVSPIQYKVCQNFASASWLQFFFNTFSLETVFLVHNILSNNDNFQDVNSEILTISLKRVYFRVERKRFHSKLSFDYCRIESKGWT